MAQGGVPSWYWPNENYGLRVLDDGTLELVALNGVVALSILSDGTLVGGNLNLKELKPGVDPHDAATVSQLGSGPGGSGSTGATGATGPPGTGGGAGATGATGPGGSSGGPGATGASGAAGGPGGGITIPYTYSSRRDGAPDPGQFSWYLLPNWAPGNLVAVPSYTDTHGVSWQSTIATLMNITPGTLGYYPIAPFLFTARVWSAADPTVFVEFPAQSLEDNGTFYVAFTAQNGSIVDSSTDPFINGERVYMTITPSGPIGSPGGGQALQYTAPDPPSLLAPADPGLGNAQYVTTDTFLTGATSFCVSATDRFGNDLSTLLLGLTGSTSAIPSRLHAYDVNDPGAHGAYFEVLAVSDNATWFEIDVTYVDGGAGWYSNPAHIVLNFSATGDKGDVGATGPTGTSGGAGATGATGPQGMDGLDGRTGGTGNTGTAGGSGATGATGPQGVDGLDGAVGATGSTGPGGTAGGTGATGNTGASGGAGGAGATGSTGPSGLDGLDGQAGATGSTGPGGTAGGAGATGNTGASGAAGGAGATGATGPQGFDGLDGQTGFTGATGTAGTTGGAGATGATGPQGLDGLDGGPGATGTAGLSGATGASGASGTSVSDALNLFAPATPVLAQNYFRLDSITNTNVLSSGRAQSFAIPVPPSTPCTNMTCMSMTTAANLPTNWWMALYDINGVLIRQSTDQLTTAWAANTAKTLALDSVPVTAGARVASATVTLTFPTMSQAIGTMFVAGDTIVVSNANIAAYNGTFTIASVGATTITYVSGGSATDSLVAPFPTVQLAASRRVFTSPGSLAFHHGSLMMKATTVITLSTKAAVGGPAPTIGTASLGQSNSGASSLTGTAPTPYVSSGGASQLGYCEIT